MEGVIYKYTNKINGKVYIGQTTREKSRYNQHMESRTSNHENSIFHNAIKKHGWDSFEYKVLFRINCSNFQDLINTLDSKERVAIKYFNSTNNNYGYNLSSGGRSGYRTIGKPIFQINLEDGSIIKGWDSIREAYDTLGIDNSSISKACKKKKPYKGYIWLYKEDYNINVVSDIIKNYKKRQLKNKKKQLKNEEKNRIKKDNEIVQLSIKGSLIKIWNSVVEAGNSINISPTTIIDVINHKYCTAGGYIWMKLSEYNNLDINLYLSNINIKKKSIVQFSLDGKFIKIWDSLSEAIKSTGAKNISKVASSKKGTSGGFMWRYEDEWNGKDLLPLTNDINLINKMNIGSISLIKPVVQFSLDGKFIRIWPSISEAKTSLNISNISLACIHKERTAGGFIWRYEDEWDRKDLNKFNKRPPHNIKKVVQLTKEGEYIRDWNSISEAEKTLGRIGISAVCSGQRNMARGFKWIYAEDYYGKKEGN